jgi:hypothetical protein
MDKTLDLVVVIHHKLAMDREEFPKPIHVSQKVFIPSRRDAPSSY